MTAETARTEIQIETHEIRIIRFRGKRFSTYCEQCRVIVTAFSLEQAVAFFRVTPEDVLRRIAEEKFHLVGTTLGLPLICGNSLGDENKELMLRTSELTKVPQART
jgi:CRISPR/Cas system CMR-associated protein Cmr5 small subunit